MDHGIRVPEKLNSFIYRNRMVAFQGSGFKVLQQIEIRLRIQFEDASGSLSFRAPFVGGGGGVGGGVLFISRLEYVWRLKKGT